MIGPAHLGLEHPNLLWIVVVGILAFVAGLAVNLYRSDDETATKPDPVGSDDDP